jgi:ssDNA-binding Zn-finger/Zn-ribbon topoisomerase 1
MDRDIVKKYQNTIIELWKEKNVKLEKIYETIKEPAQLVVSVKTFRKYVYELNSKETKETMSEKRPETKTALPLKEQEVAILAYMKAHVVQCPQCENQLKTEDGRKATHNGKDILFFQCPKCKKKFDALKLCEII